MNQHLLVLFIIMSGELFVANAGMSGARRRWLVRRRGSRKVQPTPGRDFRMGR